MNGKTVPGDIVQRLSKGDNTGEKYSVLQLFGNLRLTARWTVLYINWLVNFHSGNSCVVAFVIEYCDSTSYLLMNIKSVEKIGTYAYCCT